MNIQTKQVLSAILAVVSSAGVAGTAYLAVKSHEKAVKVTDDKKAKIRAYAPAIAVGTATVASIFASHFLSKRAEASLIASATLLDQGWRRYQYKVKDILGIDSHKKVIDAIAEERSAGVKVEDEKELYYVEPIGFFKAKPEDLAWAYGDMNQRLHSIDPEEHTAFNCLIYDMIRDAKGEILDKNIDTHKLNWGWSSEYLIESEKPQWIHMTLTKKCLSDGRKYTLIEFDESPIFDPSNGGSAYLDALETLRDRNEYGEFSVYKKVEKSEAKDNGECADNN